MSADLPPQLSGTDFICTESAWQQADDHLFNGSSYTGDISDYLNRLCTAVVSCQAAFALWRSPQSNTIWLLADFSEKEHLCRPDLSAGEKGFVISPFYNPDGSLSRFLKADALFRFEANNCCYTGSYSDQILATLNHSGRKADTVPYYETQPRLTGRKISTTRPFYTGLVKKGLSAIKAQQLSKVVLARQKVEKLPANFNATYAFCQLEKKYPSAFVSFVALPGTGSWIGATPESLLHTRSGLMKTTALAGTRPCNLHNSYENSCWHPKEQKEQAIVEAYIEQQFNLLNLPFHKMKPVTVQAANVQHIKTEYQAKFDPVKNPHLPDRLLHLLHPTPAVCGTDKDRALNFILSQENIDRSLYCGFLGPVNFNSCSQFYVNLRCMQLTQTQACLYAGAGITSESEPEKEWLETELKCQMLLDTLYSQVHL